MNTKQSNVSFPSARVFCSKAKIRLFLLASLLCLIGSAWAGSRPFDLTMADVPLEHIKGTLKGDSTEAQGTRPRRMPPIVPPIPVAKPYPTPLGPPTVPPANRAKR